MEGILVKIKKDGPIGFIREVEEAETLSLMASLAMFIPPSSPSLPINRRISVPIRTPRHVEGGNPRNKWGLRVRASTGIVLVEKSEAEKVPQVKKIVVNCGIGEAAQNSKGLDAAMKEMALVTGQRPVKTRARVSIATFKLREGQPIGIACTLRGNVMYSFLDRLINLGLPRTRDFQGVNPSSFDGHGNFSIGMREQSVFPEIKYDALGKPRGMDVCIATTAKTDKEAQRLLALMGMPFREGSGGSAIVRKKKKKAHHFDSKSRGRR
ncbi:ribosomal L5P family protein isoform X2 [Tasmannia lanceolata]|uniref:ribosomal L5P family protein isoform X2 n=1 Tax=Tasmannia lanceolata TaxID=3420 RepID=UPI0040632B9C